MPSSFANEIFPPEGKAMDSVEGGERSAKSGLFSDLRWVPWVLAAYFLVQAIVRIALPNSLRVDEAQQFVVAQWLDWGYDAQPPLYNWIQQGVFAVFGTTLASLVVLKNVLLFLVYYTYHRVARLLLADKGLAAIATLSLLTMPQMFWQAQRDLTHTVGTLLAICLFLHSVVSTLRKPSFISYASMGVWVGVGMLTKYNFILIVLATFVAVLRHPDGLKRVLDKRLLLTILLAILVFLPHGLWMTSHMSAVIDQTTRTMSEQGEGGKLSDIGNGLKELFGTGIVIILPTAVIFLIFFRKAFLRSFRARGEWSDFVGTILVATLSILLLMILVVTLTEFRDRWLLPFLFLTPLYFCLKLEASGVGSAEVFRKFLYVPLTMMVVLPLVIAGSVILPKFFGSYEHLNTPYTPFLEQVVAAEGRKPAAVVTTTWQKAGNVRINMPDTPVISIAYPLFDIDHASIGHQPLLLVWNERDGKPSTMPVSLTAWLKEKYGEALSNPEQHDMAVPYYYGREPDRYHFGYAWVYPNGK
ncbi:glycosyl transferase family 39 [Agrobacterium rhizogenes]|nr:glycosyl transferase family 39 [Rhizobium rhizogenes]NTG76008.1 glycosyl transferase family 39 [Rhizobium rhizogenes]NTG88766.1 glycosyl transferase family 39 [Rhizobium rhizogenes]NTI31164.1 glycosyl transferase family 39 [Rhizobium rhizogenes]